jgi:hypothetical protein
VKWSGIGRRPQLRSGGDWGVAEREELDENDT